MLFETDHARLRREGEAAGKREMLDRVEALFAEWAVTHPDPVVRDELWGFVDRIRREVVKV